MNAPQLRVRTVERASIWRTLSSATVQQRGKEMSASSVSLPEEEWSLFFNCTQLLLTTFPGNINNKDTGIRPLIFYFFQP